MTANSLHHNSAEPRASARQRDEPNATTSVRSAATQRLLLMAMLLLPLPALAHDGHGADGFVAGLLHPLTGIDHLLAIAAIGWWSSTATARWRWQVPLAFVAMMLAGALAGIAGLAWSGTEMVIVASVVMAGAMLLLGARLGVGIALIAAGTFAFAHGLAHGSELLAQHATQWLAGMVIATLVLQLLGAAAGRLARERVRWATPLAGALTITTGIILATGLLAG